MIWMASNVAPVPVWDAATAASGTPQAVEIIARELGIPIEQVTKCGGESRLLVGKTKEGGLDA